MGYRVAVATSDQIHIDQHFGQTESFTIYQVKDDGSYEQLGVREAGVEEPLCPSERRGCGCGRGAERP
jgi:predicted Fe-Mo cluster-binding NifX family protein